MFDLTLLTVSPVVATEGGNVIAQIAGQFGVEWKLLIAQIINFLLVAYLLYRFAFKPVLKTLDQRQKRIADGLQFSEEMEEKLKESEKQYVEKMKEAVSEAKAIIGQARDQSKAYLEEQTQEAIVKADAIISKAQIAIELEKRQMLNDARKELAQLVVATAGKVLQKDLTAEDRNRFTQTVVQELAVTRGAGVN